jgi:hypothetical protein
LLLLRETRLTVLDLSGRDIDLRLKVFRVDLEKQIAFFYLLIVSDADPDDWT